MKIVDLTEFLEFPENTIFTKFEPCIHGQLMIKMESTKNRDFFYESIASVLGSLLSAPGDSYPMTFEGLSRDGMFDEGQLFAVWEESDIRSFVARLQHCLPPSSVD